MALSLRRNVGVKSMSDKTIECDLCGDTIFKHDAIETSNEDGEIVYICKKCAEDEENAS